MEPVPEPQPQSEKPIDCPHPLATGFKPHLFYRCLLDQYAQKLRIPAPLYQAINEGVDHHPKFRATVLIDGITYTSSNTFHLRKMAEMDVSKIAYCDIIQKSKDEALRLLQEDKHSCKSILMEYAAKMNIEKPNYETQGILVPGAIFRSSLVFNGVTYFGEISKNKREAEQLAARVAILKHLESESGNDMSEIVIFKLRQGVASSSQGKHAGSLAGVGDNSALNEARIESDNNTMPKSSTVPDPCVVQDSTVPSVVAQKSIPMVSVEAASPAISAQTPVATISFNSIDPVVPIITQSPKILTQIPSVEINNSSTPIVVQPCLGHMGNVPETHTSPNVVQPANSKGSSGTIVSSQTLASSQALEYISLTDETSKRKRKRKRKRAQKKMHAQREMPAMPMGEVSPC